MGWLHGSEEGRPMSQEELEQIAAEEAREAAYIASLKDEREADEKRMARQEKAILSALKTWGDPDPQRTIDEIRRLVGDEDARGYPDSEARENLCARHGFEVRDLEQIISALF